MKNTVVVCFIISVSIIWAACTENQSSNEKKASSYNNTHYLPPDKSITPANAFNNLFFDSTKLQSFLDKYTEYASYQQQFFDFYKQRNYEYAWFDTGGVTEQASDFMNLLNTTIIESNDSDLYNKKLSTLYASFITDSTKHEKVSPLQTELYLTGEFFAYVAKVYNNKDVDATDLDWFIPKKKYDFTKFVDSVIVTKGKGEDKYLPLNKQYKLLQDELTRYYNIQKSDSWDSIAKPKKKYKR